MSSVQDATLKRNIPGKRTGNATNAPKAVQSHPHNHDIQGYMPGRKEFETEFDNDAELAIKDLAFANDDSPDETGRSVCLCLAKEYDYDVEFKLVMLDIYNTALQRRYQRRKFILDRDLVNVGKYHTHLPEDRKLDREEKEWQQQIKAFSRLMAESDFEQFSKSFLGIHFLFHGLVDFSCLIIEEKRIKKEILLLQDYRMHGIRFLKEGAEFEELRLQRVTFILV